MIDAHGAACEVALERVEITVVDDSLELRRPLRHGVRRDAT